MIVISRRINVRFLFLHKRHIMKYIQGISLLLLITISACNTTELPDYYNIRGFAQGTTYSVIYESTCNISPELMKEKIDSLLNDFDLSLSTYNDNSIISALNRGIKVETDTLVSYVLLKSKEVWKRTSGAFDITMGPLINAWGFGPDSEIRFDPGDRDSLMTLVGMDKLILEGNIVRKADQRMYIDVNAIAQGYSVDIICAYLVSIGSGKCLAEVGGEVRSVGKKYPDKSWLVQIDKPIDNNLVPGAEVQAYIKLDNKSLATSGNYRKFYIGDDGVKYSHTIDPASGAPVHHNLLSATIIADDCITADAYATACMVMGLKKSQEFLKDCEFLDAYLVYSDENGEFRSWFTDSMLNYLSE